VTIRVAVIDDWLGVARQSADWGTLQARTTVDFFEDPFPNEAAAATALEPYDIVLPMRERQLFPASLLKQLPKLKLLALTGYGLGHVDVACCGEQGILCCGSGIYTPAATAEMALALILAAQRDIVVGDSNVRSGLFQRGIAIGRRLDGAVLGIAGLGKIGSKLASYGQALGMDVIAWSPHLTEDRAQAAGAKLVSKAELFATSDVVSIHLAYAEATHMIVGRDDLSRMKSGALLVNTARAQLIDETAMISAVSAGHIRAALDVYPEEPLPGGSVYKALPSSVLSPHMGFSVEQSMQVFYEQSIENIIAFLDGQPKRVINPAIDPG
jgi:phosphoglycerate dehydrogenase-like enzyme